MIEKYKQALAEERLNGASDARIELILDSIESTNASDLDSYVLEVMMHELRKAARATREGSRSVQ